uniref:Uncharacterized protein n=1 Tax=Pithovirus LCPAC101 TaxID=2506586 RepID=A0A481Z2M8_9VIRU|nr:MAG: hypothetical protein LCPAC101_02560 [Pithovirus LCPAC101]
MTPISVYVAFNTGNDDTGRIFIDDDIPDNSSSPYVFKTAGVAYQKLVDSSLQYLEHDKYSVSVYLYTDEKNPRSVIIDGVRVRNIYVFSRSVRTSFKIKNISVVSYNNTEGAEDTADAYILGKIDSDIYKYLLIANDCNFVDMDIIVQAERKSIFFPSRPSFAGCSLIRSSFFILRLDNYFFILYFLIPRNNLSDPVNKNIQNTNNNYGLELHGDTVFKDVTVYAEDDNDANLDGLISNCGNLTGEFPRIILKDSNKSSITAITNIGGATIDFDDNNVVVNTKIESNVPVCLVDIVEPTLKTKVNLENVELDLDIPNSTLFSLMNEGANDSVYNFVRCNFKQKNGNTSLLTNTTHYRLIDGITNNVVSPTCANDILKYTKNYNHACVTTRPDITTKYNGGDIINSTRIIPPKIIKVNTNIRDIFKDDASIYFVDTSNGNVKVGLPKNVLNGLYLTFKKIDKTNNVVHIISPKEYSIEGKHCITLKTVKCTNTAIKLLFANGVYYVI